MGPCNSVPTIFHEDGTVDYPAIRNLIDFSIDGGCDVIMLTWGDSLISLLTDDEVAELHRVVIDHTGERAVMIACDNQWGRNKAVEFGRYVRELGFDVYMVRPAEWAKGTPESLADFFGACGRESPVMFVGDVPLRTLELVADDPNMWAFKEDLGLDYAHEIFMRWGDRWPMVGGGGMKRHQLLWAHGHCDTWLDGFCRTFPAVSQDYLARATAWEYRGGLGAGDALRSSLAGARAARALWTRRTYQTRDGRGRGRGAALATCAGTQPNGG